MRWLKTVDSFRQEEVEHGYVDFHGDDDGSGRALGSVWMTQKPMSCPVCSIRRVSTAIVPDKNRAGNGAGSVAEARVEDLETDSLTG